MRLLAWLIERRWLMSLLMAAVLPVSIHGARRAWDSTKNDITEWMPSGFPATRDLGEFIRYFQSDELMMVAWEGQAVDDPRAAELTERLLQPPGDAADVAPALFRRVLSAQEMVDFFAQSPLRLGEGEALERTRGWLTDGTGRQCGLLALVSPAGAANQHAALAHLMRSADAVEGLGRERLRVAGPSAEAVAIDRASNAGLFALNLASFGVCLAILVACLRSLRAAALVFLLALFNEQLCLAIIYYTGGQMDSILLLAANLTFVLSVSIGVHLVNYYRDAQATHPPADAPHAAAAAALRPTLFAVLTTVIGLGALGMSTLKPISKFGFYAAASLLAAVAVMMIYTPLHFRIWPLRLRGAGPADNPDGPAEPPPASAALRRLAFAVTLAAIGLIVGGGVGAQRLKTMVGTAELLRDDAPIIEDYRWIEERIGPLIPVEVVLTSPAGDARQMVDQFRLVAGLHQQLQTQIAGAVVISAVNLAGDPPGEGRGFRHTVRVAAFRNGLMQSDARLAELGFFAADDGAWRWRLSIRTSLFKDQGYGELLATIRRITDEQIAANAGDAAEPPGVLIAGGVPLVYETQRRMLDDLLKSFTLAFALVAITLAALFRSVAQAALAMVPNLLPVAVVFGAMGWLGWPADIGTVLTASAALGIAVDDSLHFLAWRQHAAARGASDWQAVRHAYGRCGAAMLQTTLVCGLGLAVFAASGFVPIARFGVCMALLLGLALVADLVVLPAILLSPLGRVFRSTHRTPLLAEGANHAEP